MQRTIEISVPSAATDSVVEGLEQLQDVISVSVERGAARKPLGDVVTVHTLNRGADDVLKIAAGAQRYGSVSVSTSQLESVIDPEHQGRVGGDTDDTIWEAMEESVRHQSRVTFNYLLVMALGGGIAAIGLVAEPVPQAVSFVAAAVIATGFEPIVKLPLALVFWRRDLAQRGLLSASSGYVVLILAAAATFLILRLSGDRTVEQFVQNPEVHRLAHPTVSDILRSAFGALAGVTMITAARWYVLAGPLIALELIPAAAMAGTAIVAGQPDLIFRGLVRLGIDVLLIVVLGLLVLLGKQATAHRRRPQPMVSMSANPIGRDAGTR